MQSLNYDHQQTDQRQLLLSSESTKSKPDYPMQQYNYVIMNYNKNHFRDNVQLEPMRESGVYRLFWKLISSFWLALLVLLLTAAPGLGFFIYIWISASVIMYFSGLGVYDKNHQRDSDPFANMIFCPELCVQDRLTNKYIEMQALGKILF